MLQRLNSDLLQPLIIKRSGGTIELLSTVEKPGAKNDVLRDLARTRDTPLFSCGIRPLMFTRNMMTQLFLTKGIFPHVHPIGLYIEGNTAWYATALSLSLSLSPPKVVMV